MLDAPAPVTPPLCRRLDGCLKRIRAREQSSLIAGLRATNEQALLRLNEERKLEREKEEEVGLARCRAGILLLSLCSSCIVY